MSSTSQYGLIILGNSGAGKSFLVNIISGTDTFLHLFKATSVTQITTSINVTLGSHTFTIFDIPGLIEAQQERIDLNKQEIDKAFTQRPNSIILFVFGQVNGRLRGQDIVAFNAINVAYPFKSQSLVLVVNGVPRNRPSDYEGETVTDLQQLLKDVDVNNGNVCFTDLINVDNVNEKQTLKNQLVLVVTKFAPQFHQKTQDIQTLLSQLKISEDELKKQQHQLEEEREKLRKQLEEQKRIAQQQIDEEQKRKAELEARLKEQEEQRLADERRRADERAAQEAEAKRLQTKLPPIWQRSSSGHVPENAVVGGHDNNGQHKLYVARFTNAHRQFAPGKLYPQHKVCYNGCCWKEFSSQNYEVLTHPVWEQALKWVPTTANKLPAGAVQGGIRSDCGTDPIYVCRGFVNGSLVPGKFHPGCGGAYLPYGGKEHFVTIFEVLVWTPHH